MIKGKTGKLILLFVLLLTTLLALTTGASAETLSGRCGSKMYWAFDTQTGALEFTGSGAMFAYEGTQAPWLAHKDGIRSVTFESGITSLADKAFYGCGNLAQIQLPDKITRLGTETFYGCKALKTLPLGTGVTEIGDRCFYGCSALEQLIIPEGVVSIGEGAFRGCTAVKTVSLPKSLTGLAENFLRGCTKITSLTVADGNPICFSAGNCIVMSQTGTLIVGCDGSVIPDDTRILSIGQSAFAGCKDLRTVTIPASVTQIGSYAFSGCTGLNTVTLPQGLVEIGDGAFQGCTGLTSVDLPDSLKILRSCAFSGCLQLSAADLPAGLEHFGSWAFSRTNITKVHISGNVSYVGINPFRGCNSLQELTVDYRNRYYKAIDGCLIDSSEKRLISGRNHGRIPAGGQVTSIGRDAFCGMDVQTVILPDSVAFIRENAFAESGLREIALSANLVTVEGNPFRGCKELTKFSVPENNSGFAAGEGCLIRKADKTLIAGTAGAVIPADGSVTVIGPCAFADQPGLDRLEIPETVTTIGADAFFRCEGLVIARIPASVTYIGQSAFALCSAMTHIEIRSLPQISPYAFLGCEKLGTVCNLSGTSLTPGSTDHGYLTYYAHRITDTMDFRAAVYLGGKLKGIYESFDKALEWDGDGYIVLLADDRTQGVLSRDLYIDLAGFTLSGTLDQGSWKIFGMDSATNDYTSENMGHLTCTRIDGTPLAVQPHFRAEESLLGTVRRYLTARTEEGITFHRFYIGLTHRSLNTHTVGLGYKGVFIGDEYVTAALNPRDAFGFVLYLDGYEPVRGFQPAANVRSAEAVSLRVDNYDVENFGETPLRCYVYLNLSDGTQITTGVYSTTLRSMVEYVNANAAAYPAGQLGYIASLMEQFPVMKQWATENIIALAPDAGQ